MRGNLLLQILINHKAELKIFKNVQNRSALIILHERFGGTKISEI